MNVTQPMPLRETTPQPARLRAGPGGRLSVVLRADAIEVHDDAGRRISLGLEAEAESLRLRVPSGLREHLLPALCGAIESLTAGDRKVRLAVDCDDGDLVDVLVREGIAIHQGRAVIVEPALVWQQPRLWLPQATSCGGYPQLQVMSGDRRHPHRAPKPTGTCYARAIPWLDRVLSFVVVDVERDLPLYHRWMNDPRVEVIWGDGGDLGRHRGDLEERTADPHVLPLIGYADDVPFGYFEVYWAKENRLGPHYDVADYDRGWHVAIGEEAFRGRAWITAWLPSLMHFIFLDDIRTQRIVGEPKASHAQQIRNLDRAGFAKIKHIDFPHKQALLVMLLRERFFADRLWAPEDASPSEGFARA